jgi:cephalosporin hydroxylase
MPADEGVRMTGSPPPSRGEDPGAGRPIGGEISEAFFRLYGESRVWMNTKWLTVDIEEREGRPRHDRITYLTGSSVDPEIVAQVRSQIVSEERVMVLLDSDHSKEHVLAELSVYAPLVSEDCYLIVEDTGVGLVDPEFGPGPAEAVEEFLAQDHPPFTVDRDCEKFFITVQPGGYLRRGSSFH